MKDLKDFYFTNLSIIIIIIWILRIYISRIVVQSIHAHGQALTIRRFIFSQIASITELVKYKSLRKKYHLYG